MVITLDEIRAYKDYLTGDLYTDLRGEQGIDQSYIDDSFLIEELKDTSPLRSGLGDKIVSTAAEQLVTNLPQVFIKTDKKGDIDSANNLSREVNEIWVPSLQRQLPNIFKEIVKNKIARGESYIQLAHNESWVIKDRKRYGMPVLFMAPEPMVIYGSPEEDDCGWIPNTGVPNRVVIFYERQPRDVLLHYPSWTNPLKKGEKSQEKQTSEFWGYIDKDVRYFEADGEALLQGGIQPNIYGFVPFVRKFSGFGKRSPTGSLSDLIVSDIRRSRGLLREECVLRSDIASILHTFAHKPVTVIVPQDTVINEAEFRKQFNLGSSTLNILYLPEPHEIQWGVGDNMLPTREVFAHLSEVKSEIRERYPFLMVGFPMGSSGRQQDLTSMGAMRRYDTVTENSEDEVATAIEMALTISGKVPKLRPDSIKKKDLEIPFRCKVVLKAEDPVENDRKATLGSRLYQQGEIDLETNLIKYQGYTITEAEDIITNILVERVTLNSPEIAELLGLKAAERAGMMDELKILRDRQKQMEGGGGLGQQVGMAEMAQRTGETKTPSGFQMIDEALRNRGQRFSPSRYTRGT